MLPCLISELKRSPLLNQCYQQVIEPRRELMRDVLRRGIASGELRADLDIEVVMAMLVGPMLAQSIFDWNPHLDREKLPDQLVDAIWPAIAAHSLTRPTGGRASPRAGAIVDASRWERRGRPACRHSWCRTGLYAWRGGQGRAGAGARRGPRPDPVRRRRGRRRARPAVPPDRGRGGQHRPGRGAVAPAARPGRGARPG